MTNLARTLRDLQQLGVWIYGLAGEAEASFYSLDLRGNVALVLGGEGDGLRRLTRENCDHWSRSRCRAAARSKASTFRSPPA